MSSTGKRLIAPALLGTTGVAAVLSQPLVLVTVVASLALVVLVILLGVVLPAVWSKKGYRRTAAACLISRFLDAVTGRREGRHEG